MLRALPITLFAVVLGGCVDKVAPHSGGQDSDSEPGPEWSVMADGIGAGVLLSAWSDGDAVLFVGGDLAGGPGTLVRYEAGALCFEAQVTERALWWIHGPQPGEWYAVGEAGTVLKSLDGERSRMDVPTESTLFGVWADGAVLWAVGGSVPDNTGEIWRHSEGAWELVLGDLPGLVFKVWDGWFVGAGIGLQLRGDELVDTVQDQRLLTVRGASQDDVWGVGGLSAPVARHWTDGAWQDIDTFGIGQPLNGVWTAPGEDVWVAGNFGTTLRYANGEWDMPGFPVSSEHFHAVWKHGEEVLFAGGNLFSPGNNYGTIARWGMGAPSLTATECP